MLALPRPLLTAALAVLLAPLAARAQTPGTCVPARATADLDIGGVRARLFNDGALFWKGAGNVYNVPRSPLAPGSPNAIFAHGLWLGGMVGTELRQSAATYSNWEMWPGPLGADGELPGDRDCAKYDRIYTVSKRDVADYERAGTATADLRDWPVALGAPVLDGDGVQGNYRLAGGDRPEIAGHQSAFWVMNDVGSTHRRTGSKPIGLEVRVLASAFRSDDAALDFTTVYRYTVVYRGKQPLTQAWLGFFSDPDLGDATDDYIGSDSVLGMGYVYNADNNDASSDGYGMAPPALGYVLLDGPRVRDTDRDGTPDAPGATRFLIPNEGNGDPDANTGYWYKALQGLWRDGRAMFACGNGHDGQFASCGTARFMFPGDPTASGPARFWSEFQTLPTGTAANAPNDRRFLLSTGPFTLQPGEAQTFTLAIVWARGASNLDSVTRLKAAARSVQATYSATRFLGLPQRGFGVAPVAAPVAVSPAEGATGQPASVLLRWSAVERAEQYEVEVCDTLSGEGGAFCARAPRVLQSVREAVAATTAPGRVTWRVRGANEAGFGPWSAVFAYGSSGEALATGSRGFDSFLVTANGAGPLAPPEFGALDPNRRGFPRSGAEAAFDATAASQVGPATFGIHTWTEGSTDGGFDRFFSRVTRDGGLARAFAGHDFEWRFTGSSVAYNFFQDQATYTVPFELWDVGTKPDASDDVRMIPLINESTGDPAVVPGARATPNHVFDLGPDHPTSGGLNDPQTDWVYWYRPLDTTPGQAGYQKYAADIVLGATATKEQIDTEVFARMVLVSFNGGTQWAGPFSQPLPEPGTVFRINTSRLRAPVASAPLDGATTGDGIPVLHWQEPAFQLPPTSTNQTAPDAVVWRRVQVASDPAFAALVADDTTATEPALAVTRPLVAGTRYYWRVRVRLNYGAETDWSAPAAFTAGASTAAEIEGALPDRVALSPAYPNPFHAASAVRYGLPTAGRVRLALYDVLGRRVAVLADGVRAAGWHDAALDGSALASGVYVVRLEAGGRVVTRSVVRVR